MKKDNEYYNTLIQKVYDLAVAGNRITVPFLQKELNIEEPNLTRALIGVLVKYGKIIYVDLDGERFWMDTSKLNPDFGMPNSPDKDEKLIELIVSAKKGETHVYTAIVDIDKIKPFCNYKPSKENFEKTRKQLKENIERHDPPFLHVYQDGDSLVMSDDYYAYYMYLEVNFKKVPCIIFGDTDISGVQDKKKINYI